MARSRRDGGCMGLALPLAALLLVLAAPAAAYPSFWIFNHLDAGLGLGCIDHPTTATLSVGHTFSGLTSNATSFNVTNPSGALTATICPGVQYTLGVNLPSQNHWFLTVDAPNALPNGATPAGCSGSRQYAANSQATKSFTVPLQLPAGSTATSVMVKVSSAVGNGNTQATGIYVNNLRLPVGSAAACSGASSPSPSPSPNPSSPSPNPTSPSPSPNPTSPSPSPAPKPSPSPSPSPGPISNYTGTCASAGACAVCASATRCAACYTPGYILNDATGRCDCAPGYKGSTATKSSRMRHARMFGADGATAAASNTYLLCSACSDNSVSPGGGKSTAVCTYCSNGDVANSERSVCLTPKAWPTASLDVTNRRFASQETKIGVSNVGLLTKKWNFTADGDVSATPTVVNGSVYFPSWKGSVYCLSASTGKLVWKQNVETLLNAWGATQNPPVSVAAADKGYIVSRTAIAVSNGMVYLGLMRRNIGGYPYMMALSAADGSVKWAAKLDDNPAALITQAPNVYKGYVYIGVSSMEEARAGDSSWPCCSFRGSYQKLNAATGAVAWKTYTTPLGWSGASVWGSAPPIDAARNQVVIATGDNYDLPTDVAACLSALGPLTGANAAAAAACEQLSGGKDNWRNSVLALDLATGAIKWGVRLGGPDAWNAACFQDPSLGNPNCPNPAGPDYDFGQAPVLVTSCDSSPAKRGCKQMLIVGQKAGIVWSLSPDTGALNWWRQTGPPGVIGGMMWGSASDNARIYISNNNFFHQTLDPVALNAVPAGTPATTGGMLAALNTFDGSLLWSFFNPLPQVGNPSKQALSQGPVTVANGVVYYPVMDALGTLFFLNGATGQLLGNFTTGATDACGPSIVDGVVYTGSGYSNFGLGAPGQQVTALSLPSNSRCPQCAQGCEDNGQCRGPPPCPQCKYGCEDNGQCKSSHRAFGFFRGSNSGQQDGQGGDNNGQGGDNGQGGADDNGSGGADGSGNSNGGADQGQGTDAAAVADAQAVGPAPAPSNEKDAIDEGVHPNRLP